jgi:hypothetical protein
MQLHFCDLCNESIPQADLDLGRAVRRNERLICAACEAAMSSGHERPVPRPPAVAAPLAPPRPAPAPAGGTFAAVGLAFSVVALLVAAGFGGFLFVRHEERARTLEQALTAVERAAPEQVRTVSAALRDEVDQRESELAEARARIAELATRLAEVERSSSGVGTLERRLDRLEPRLGAVSDLESRLEHVSGAFEQLAASVGELSAARHAPATLAAAPAEAPARPAPRASAEEEGTAAWQAWIAELASADSGTRWQAVQGLGDTHDARVVPHLVPMLRDTDIFVRMAACRHLGDLASVEAIPALIDTLEDEEASVREAALVALRALSGQSIAFDPLAREGDRSKRVKAWREWWEEASKELLAPGRTRSKS